MAAILRGRSRHPLALAWATKHPFILDTSIASYRDDEELHPPPDLVLFFRHALTWWPSLVGTGPLVLTRKGL
jgi:hypothetical protein